MTFGLPHRETGARVPVVVEVVPLEEEESQRGVATVGVGHQADIISRLRDGAMWHKHKGLDKWWSTERAVKKMEEESRRNVQKVLKGLETG
jgi:hypothetical protein